MHARRVQVPLFPRPSRLKTDCRLVYRSTSQVIVETNMAETAIKRTARGTAQAGHASSRDHQVPSAASWRRDRDDAPLVQWWSDVGRSDIAMVGGKNASLDELIDQLRDAGKVLCHLRHPCRDETSEDHSAGDRDIGGGGKGEPRSVGLPKHARNLCFHRASNRVLSPVSLCTCCLWSVNRDVHLVSAFH